MTLVIFLTIWFFVGFISALIIMIKSEKDKSFWGAVVGFLWVIIGSILGVLTFALLCSGDWKR